MSDLFPAEPIVGRRRWVSPEQAAEYLGVHTQTVRDYITRGVLPAHKIRASRLVRIDVADLDRLMEPLGGAK